MVSSALAVAAFYFDLTFSLNLLNVFNASSGFIVYFGVGFLSALAFGFPSVSSSILYFSRKLLFESILSVSTFLIFLVVTLNSSPSAPF